MDVTNLFLTVAFVLLTGLAARLWLRQRTATTVWLVWMFVVLAGSRVLSLLLPPEPEGVVAVLAQAVPVATVAFPYLLFRFGASFQPLARRWEAVAAAAGGSLVVAAVVVPALYTPADPLHRIYVVWALLVWTALSGWVTVRLWLAGQRQPTVAKTRMRTLAIAAAALNGALVLAGVSAQGGAEALVDAARLVALGSAPLFLLGVAPPQFVRTLWRRADERTRWSIESGLIGASSRDEVISYMLPRVNHLLGGGGAMFMDQEEGEATVGIPDARRQAFRDSVLGAARGAPNVSGETMTMVLREGRLAVGANPYTPLFGEDDLELMHWLGSLIDLALSRADLYDREREARTRAESLAEEVEALLYGISHDLRTPIVSVRGYLDCLAEDYGHLLDETGEHFLARLRANTGYMDQLISDLLELSRVGRLSAEAEPVELGAVAERIAEELRATYPDATIEVSELPTVLLSQPRARQLLTNLMTNAVVHSGRPDVTVRVKALDETDDQDGIAVVDNGRGIPPAHRERVFGIFEQLDRRGRQSEPSTGIGLAISQRIVEQAGGRIWIADSDKGADVRVALPRGSASTQRREATT